MTAAIVARGLTKRFGKIQAVTGIDLVVPAGSCFGLIGENGAGKTTFIKMVLSIVRPDAGSIEVLGGSPDNGAVRAQVGYLPERMAIPEAFSPLRFLASVGRLRGVAPEALRAECERVLVQVGLDRAAWTRATGGFSKGMKQRTGLAAALLGNPKLLILDEPTDGIDPIGRAEIRDVIAAAVRTGCTVFLNSHLLAETEKICDHVAVLSHGRVAESGTLSKLSARGGHRVSFLMSAGDQDIAARHGFIHAEDVALEGKGAFRVYRHSAKNLPELSQALRGALDAGLVVVEVAPERRDLETILRESIAVNAAGAP